MTRWCARWRAWWLICRGGDARLCFGAMRHVSTGLIRQPESLTVSQLSQRCPHGVVDGGMQLLVRDRFEQHRKRMILIDPVDHLLLARAGDENDLRADGVKNGLSGVDAI